MRCLESRRLTQIQAVWHSDNIFTNFEPNWSTLKIEADKKFSRRQFIWRAKGETTDRHRFFHSKAVLIVIKLSTWRITPVSVPPKNCQGAYFTGQSEFSNWEKRSFSLIYFLENYFNQSTYFCMPSWGFFFSFLFFKKVQNFIVVNPKFCWCIIRVSNNFDLSLHQGNR